MPVPNKLNLNSEELVLEASQKATDINKWLEERENYLKELRKSLVKEENVILDFFAHVRIEKLMAIHLTDFFPTEGFIIPTGDSIFFRMLKSAFTKRAKIEKSLNYGRKSIHFTLNHALSAHGGGDWTAKKFAILIPFKDIRDRVYSVDGVDTWVIGMLKLPESAEILMHDSHYSSEFDNNRGKAQIVFYSDDFPIDLAVKRRMLEKGYAPVGGGPDWHLEHAFIELKKYYAEMSGIANESKIRQIEYRIQHTVPGAYGEYQRIFNQINTETGVDSYNHADGIFYRIESAIGRFESYMKYGQGNLDVVKRELEACIDKIIEIEKNIASVRNPICQEEMEALNSLKENLSKMRRYCNYFKKG